MEHVPLAKTVLMSLPNKLMDGMRRQQQIMRAAARELLQGLGDAPSNTMQSVISEPLAFLLLTLSTHTSYRPVEGSAAAPLDKKLSEDEILSNAVSVVGL